MSRVQTLTDSEYKILLAIREAAAQTHTSSVGDMRTELESIYYDLENMSSGYWEDELPGITRRLYQLLH